MKINQFEIQISNVFFRAFMTQSSPNKITIFFVISLIGIAAILISSFILINGNSVDQALQGWVNLVWIPLIVVLLFLDRLFVKKFGAKRVNKIQSYIFSGIILLFILNWFRLSIQ